MCSALTNVNLNPIVCTKYCCKTVSRIRSDPDPVVIKNLGNAISIT
jgi:hypothetical protein